VFGTFSLFVGSAAFVGAKDVAVGVIAKPTIRKKPTSVEWNERFWRGSAEDRISASGPKHAVQIATGARRWGESALGREIGSAADGSIGAPTHLDSDVPFPEWKPALPLRKLRSILRFER
jgi:hypothetical protein